MNDPVLPNPMPAPESEPFAEALTVNRFRTLEQMVAANGCHADYTVERHKRKAQQPGDLYLYLTAYAPIRTDVQPGRGPDDQAAMTRIVKDDLPARGRPQTRGLEETIYPYRVEAYRHVGENSEIPIDQLLSQTDAWVQTFWLADPTCGGLATTTWKSDEGRRLDVHPPAIVLYFEVKALRPSGSPFSLPANP